MLTGAIGSDGIIRYDATQKPFSIYGLYNPQTGEPFVRMPSHIAQSVSENVSILHTNTAGGRVRFITDSPFIEISAKFPFVCRFPHMTLLGSSGFDIYEKRDGKQVYLRSGVVQYKYSRKHPKNLI